MLASQVIPAKPPINPNTKEAIKLNKKKYQYSLLLALPENVA
jgi:hypothetical protein